MASSAMGPTCRVASWLATLLLLLMATSSSCANDPSYTDCQPHIDATIRDLASKALKDGKLPLRPEPDDTAAPTSGGSSGDAPTIEKLPSETSPAQDLDNPAPEESKLLDPAEAGPNIEEEVHLDAVPTTVSIDTESISTRAEESLPPPTEAAPPSAAAPETAPVRVQSTNIGHTDGSAESQNLINKLVTSIFGKFPTERDAKWATPWQSHPEHIRAPVSQEKVEVSKEPGVVSKSINKMVVAIFGEHSAERDPKWADPWQTHPEHERKIPATSEQPREVIQDPRGGVLHRLICLVFDEPPKERDPKFAEPWQTHTDQQEKFKSSSEESVEAKPVVVASGGLLDKIVRTIFPAPDVERDPKYARPWQTHDEHIKVSVPAPEVNEIAHGSGGILDRLVRLAFPLDTENAVRDPKWAEPWQTHNPVKTQPVTAPEEKRVSTATTFPLFVFFDGLICKIFNIAPKERDPKWAIPWQDHDEHKKSIVEKRSEQIEQKVIGPTGGLLDKFVRTVFGLNETGERDPKYATPWQTHEEAGLKFQRADLVIDASPPAPKVVHEKTTVPEIKPEQKPSPEPVTYQTTTPPSKREERTLQEPVVVETLIQAGEESEEENKPLSQEGKGAGQDGTFRAEKVLDSVAEAAVAEKADHGSIDAPIVPTTPTKEEKSPYDDHDDEDDEEAEDIPQFVTATGETVLQDSDDEEPDDDAEPDEVNASSASAITTDETDLGTDDESDQIILVPAALRPRDHIEAILGLDEASRSTAMRSNPISDAALKELKNIYESSIKPLEVIYKYQDISNRHMSDAEIFGQPLVLVLGPYSTGKSSLLNYLMNVEYTRRALRTGANPSHGVFRIIQYGPEDAEVDGTALSASAHFGSLQKFGQNFVDQLRGSVRNVPLLKKVGLNFVDKPNA
ncbi:uncharacterized protein LOC108682068 [Hyalella azteca]|uniref:Uncharacterized protein LOC108682068 n=1 Tax=Hyalella azteca TaxID=294128 RepID=A0A8B7PMR8_HYAAZ|nr:uncharacterized protein LOC108682068 [Hyalella azteca]